MKADNHLSTAGSTKHTESATAGRPVTQKHRNKLGNSSAEINSDPYGNGKPSTENKVGNAPKTW